MKILLAVDGSKCAEGAARFLTFLNLSPEDEITVFHALQWGHYLLDEKSYQTVLKEIKKTLAPGILDAALDILKPVKAKVSAAIVEGPAKQTIIDKAMETNADLIVMGARGAKSAGHLFLGSVSHAVATRSPVPVLITKLPLTTPQGGMKMLFATDGSVYSMAAQKFLTSMPFPGHSEVTVINVKPTVLVDMPITFVPELNERYAEAIEEIRKSESSQSAGTLDQARQILLGHFEKVDIISAEGDASTEILAASRSLKADLIVAGCRGLTGFKGMIGSVSRNILSHSKCPVLIGKICED